MAAKEAERDGVPASSLAWLTVCGHAFFASDMTSLKLALNKALTVAVDPGAAAAAAAAAAAGSASASASCASADEETLSTVDHVWGARVAGAPTVVLYAPLGSESFALAHATLVSAAESGSVSYVYRPLVAESAGAPRQPLQGYGVELAIKNMEYKAMDDQQIEDLGGIDPDGGEEDSEESAVVEEVDHFGFLIPPTPTPFLPYVAQPVFPHLRC